MVEHWETEVDKALGELGADVPEMDDHAFAAGRARLLATIAATPVAEPATTSSDAVVFVLPAELHPRSPTLRKAAPWLAVAASVVAVAVGVITVLPSDPAVKGSTPAGASSTTYPPPTAGPGNELLPPMPAQPLNKAGDLAAAVQDITVPSGKALYVRSAHTQAANMGDPGGSLTEELWIPADRDGGEWLRWQTASGQYRPRPEQDFEERRAIGGRFTDFEPKPWQATPKNAAALAALPRDPAALYEKLRTEDGTNLSGGVGIPGVVIPGAANTLVSMLGDATNTVPADLRAAVLRTLGYVPGVTVTPGAKASDGRTATSITWTLIDNFSRSDLLWRNEFLLDPGTGRVVEWRNVALQDFQGYKAGQTMASDLRTEAVVDAVGQRP